MTAADFRQRVTELEAYLDLGARLGLRQGLPYVRHWSAGADFLALLVEHVLETGPATIVECGSGLSTLMLARCCQLNGRGRLYSLEHAAEHAARSRTELDRYGLASQADVMVAPLRPYELGDGRRLWYDLANLTVQGIDLLVIDGPPGRLAPLARYPALPLLYHRLSPASRIYLDDAARPDEWAILQRWQSEFPDLIVSEVKTARGCAILERRPQPIGEAL